MLKARSVDVFAANGVLPVEDYVHFVYPINARRIHVFDPKIETLAYDEKERILEITFKSGQVWQMSGVPPNIYTELLHPLTNAARIQIHRRTPLV